MAVTEPDKKLGRTDEEIDDALRLLAGKGGKRQLTAEQLKEAGSTISRGDLENYERFLFPRRYLQVRHEIGKESARRFPG